jgi:TonB-linked SusC/RagA family outer membrane protein
MKKELQVHGHLLFIMRVSFIHFIYFLTFLGVAHASEITAQVLEKKVTIELKNVNLRTALQKIERTSDVKFLYQSQLISPKEHVSLTATDERLGDLLKQILEPLHIVFEADGNQIVLTRERTGSSESTPEDYSSTGAYDILISGTITDEQSQPLPGVNILVKGSSVGTTSDANGAYSISVEDENSTLVFSFIGFLTQEVAIANQTTINVIMAADVTSLQEVVVVGYGEVKKSDLTGSVASIKSEELNAYPATNLVQSLSGRAPGVQISQNTGAPGSSISVRIRGTNSLQGSNEPLYVVDGFPYSGNPTLLNNVDIESIQVLKDASATAIYGSRGANGVVIITTKRGKQGKTTVDYDGYYGWQTIRKKIEMMNAKEYALFYNEQAANDGLAPHFTQDEINSFGEGTDWQELALQTAPIQNHSLTINGGSEKTRFSISGSNFNQDGIIIGSNYIRNSVRANITTDISKKFKFDLNTILSRIDSDRKNSGGGNRGGSLISAMLSGYPTQTPYNSDGTYTNLMTAYSIELYRATVRSHPFE